MTDDLQKSNINSSPAEQAQEGILVPHSSENALIEELNKGKWGKYIRFAMAAFGSMPWMGGYLSIGSYSGVLGAVAGISAEFEQEKLNELLKLWLQEYQPKFEELKLTVRDISSRFEGLGEEIQKRIESPEYLVLVRSAFRSWDEAETAEKREYIKRLISNAGATTLCPDDLVRLFINWINNYHESHFAVIKEIYKNPGITRGEIWDKVHNERPREDSSEADLFRYLIRDLSLGGVIRQEKEIDADGSFLKKRPIRTSKGSASHVMESAFEDTKPFVLTELGKEFIHYVLNDVVQRVEGGE